MAILIFDLDGVIWRGNKLVSSRIPSLIDGLHRKEHQIYFLTNNSTLNQYGYQKKLAGLGIKARLNEIICTTNVMRMYLRKKVDKLTSRQADKVKKKLRIFVIGGKALKEEIKKLPAEIVKLGNNGRVDYVVVGIDMHFNYKKLAMAMHAILEGAEFVATNTDKTLPVKSASMLPGSGALISAISTATNCKPCVVGKPNPFIIRNAIDKSSLNGGNVYVVGDRLDTDVLLANRLGLRSVLVLSGATTREMAKKARGLHKPEYIIKDVTEIKKVLKPRRNTDGFKEAQKSKVKRQI